jgi:hypothetical protein
VTQEDQILKISLEWFISEFKKKGSKQKNRWLDAPAQSMTQTDTAQHITPLLSCFCFRHASRGAQPIGQPDQTRVRPTRSQPTIPPPFLPRGGAPKSFVTTCLRCPSAIACISPRRSKSTAVCTAVAFACACPSAVSNGPFCFVVSARPIGLTRHFLLIGSAALA